jgi:hypothetical protein
MRIGAIVTALIGLVVWQAQEPSGAQPAAYLLLVLWC